MTISKETYSGGQSIYITITLNAGDILTLDEYKALFRYEDGTYNYSKAYDLEICGDISYCELDLTNYGERYIERMSICDFFNIEDPTIKREVFLSAIELSYNRTISSGTINKYHIDNEIMFTEQFKKRFHRISRIVNAYNHDDSNSMVDYFDRNFYETYKIKIA